MSLGKILESILKGIGAIMDYMVEILLVLLILGVLYWGYKKFFKKKGKGDV